MAIVAVHVLTSAGCKDDTPEPAPAVSNARKVTAYYDRMTLGKDISSAVFTLNGKDVSVFSSDQTNIGVGTSVDIDGNPDYSLKMDVNLHPGNIIKTISGTLRSGAFAADKKNIVQIVPDGDGFKILLNGNNENVTGGGNGGGGGGGGGANSLVLADTVLEGGADERKYFTFTVPAGYTSLEVVTKESPPRGTYNAADLYVSKGKTPTASQTQSTPLQWVADKVSQNINRERESCTFQNPSGSYTVMLYHYEHMFSSNLVITLYK